MEKMCYMVGVLLWRRRCSRGYGGLAPAVTEVTAARLGPSEQKISTEELTGRLAKNRRAACDVGLGPHRSLAQAEIRPKLPPGLGKIPAV